MTNANSTVDRHIKGILTFVRVDFHPLLVLRSLEQFPAQSSELGTGRGGAMSGNNKTTLTIIGFVSVGMILGAYAFEKGLLPKVGPLFGSGVVAGQMPVCESSAARSLLQEAIDKSPRAIQSGLKVSEIGIIKDYAEDPARAADPMVDMRFCQATVFTNGGSGQVHFVMKWVDPAKSRLWLETTVWTF